MQEEIYKVKLENIFEGPMDLLVHLIKKNELDVYDIPIAMVTEQYLQYLKWIKIMNIDFAGDFIVMASTLTQIKSRMLLPASEEEEDEDDPRQEVIKPLLARYREDVMSLLEAWNRSSNRFKRRSSVVTFTRKVGESGEFTDEVLRLCENLIWDKEDIVQKGVGWALKDNLRSAPERILPYIEELRRKGVPSTITLYAIRDLKGAERDAILAVKKGSK